MKVVLVGINAKYIHTNLAIRYLKSYAVYHGGTKSEEYNQNIHLKEYSINNYLDDILIDLYKEKPEFIGISCYIWNMGMVTQLTKELKKVLPNTKIWLGGPEVSYDGKEYLESNKSIDGIIVGEGEACFLELMEYYTSHGDASTLLKIDGICYRTSAYKVICNEDERLLSSGSSALDKDSVLEDKKLEDKIYETKIRQLIPFDLIPFCYEDISEFENKIIYYETSRGCPYSCSYCLSSIDKSVRFRSTELVKKELKVFIDAKVPQVKLVDRTFNCNRKHTKEIVEFLKEYDNGVTNFHFEVAADILNEEELTLFNSLRPGLVQLEIGVQSTNEHTLDAIHRKMSFEKLKHVVYRIKEGNNIHAHLDLIVGLPYEDLSSFKQSFNDVYALAPEQLQLGFLKVLKGSAMFFDSKEFGVVYKSEPPYEVLYTNWISYDEVLLLKAVEEMVEVYYNSNQFYNSVKYMEHFFESPFDMFLELSKFYEEYTIPGQSHGRIKRYEMLIDFMKNEKLIKPQIHMEGFMELLVHDLYLRENLKSRPSFTGDLERVKEKSRAFYQSDNIYEFLKVTKEDYKPNQLKPYVHIERYEYDIDHMIKTGEVKKKEHYVIYDYMNRDKLTYDANVGILDEDFKLE